MCYSFDVLKRTAFTKEIEHIKSLSKDQQTGRDIVRYLESRIKEINEMYGDEPKRA